MDRLVLPRLAARPIRRQTTAERPGRTRGAPSDQVCRCSGELVADVAEDVRNERAQEEQRDDHDDRDEGEKQTVLNESLAFLVLALEASQKSADELTDDHVRGDLLSEKICSRSVGSIKRLRNGPMVLSSPAAWRTLRSVGAFCQVPRGLVDNYLTKRAARAAPSGRGAPCVKGSRPLREEEPPLA